MFSSAGRRVELMRCFRKDAEALGQHLRTVAVDLNPAMSPACQIADKSYPVPRCIEAAFVERLLEICSTEKVKLLVPTIDTELEALALSRERFQKIGTRVAVSTPEVVRLSRNKLETVRSLEKMECPHPGPARLLSCFRHPMPGVGPSS